MIKVKLIPVFFSTEKRKAKAILDSISKLIPQYAELTGEYLLNTWEDFEKLQENAESGDVILELSENLRPVPIRLYLRLADFGLPLVLYGGEFCPTPRRFEAAGYWKSKGNRVFLPLTRQELQEQLAMLVARRRIEQTHALLIGSRYSSTYVATSILDFKVALKTLGIQMHACPPTRLLELFDAREEAEIADLVREWLQEADEIREPKDEDLQKSARFYLAMKCILEEFGAHAVALNCIPLLDKLKATPCLALVKLNDEGIPAACEGDLTALTTMIFLERLANRPGFMGNIIYANPDENVIGINHCVFPFQMEGYGEPKKPFVLCDYHGRGFGVTASYTPELGLDVTLGRFDTMLREFMFTKGELVDWGEDYCRTNLKIHVSDVRGFIRQVRGNHHIVVYGDWTNRIRDLCGEFGIETVGI